MIIFKLSAHNGGIIRASAISVSIRKNMYSLPANDSNPYCRALVVLAIISHSQVNMLSPRDQLMAFSTSRVTRLSSFMSLGFSISSKPTYTALIMLAQYSPSRFVCRSGSTVLSLAIGWSRDKNDRTSLFNQHA